MRIGKRCGSLFLAAVPGLTNIATFSSGALVCLLPCCAVERPSPNAMRDDTRASLQPAAVLDASRPSEAGVDGGFGAISKSMDVRTGGAVAWTQADFKVSFYPGAVVDAERCQQLRLGATYSSTVVHSTSDSMRVVRAFYRKKLRESANGIAVVETSDGDSVTMVAKRGETDITMIVVERDPELGVVEITQQQLGEASAR